MEKDYRGKQKSRLRETRIILDKIEILKRPGYSDTGSENFHESVGIRCPHVQNRTSF